MEIAQNPFGVYIFNIYINKRYPDYTLSYHCSLNTFLISSSYSVKAAVFSYIVR